MPEDSKEALELAGEANRLAVLALVLETFQVPDLVALVLEVPGLALEASKQDSSSAALVDSKEALADRRREALVPEDLVPDNLDREQVDASNLSC